MITPTFIYWISILDGLKVLCGIVGFITSVGLILLLFGYIFNRIEGEDESADVFRKFVHLFARISISTILLCGFVPCSKTLAAMYIVPAIANNEKVQDVGNRLYDLAVEWMDELKPGKRGK